MFEQAVASPKCRLRIGNCLLVPIYIRSYYQTALGCDLNRSMQNLMNPVFMIHLNYSASQSHPLFSKHTSYLSEK